MPLRHSLLGRIGAALSIPILLAAATAAAESSRLMTPEIYFDVCGSPTLADATAKGDALGWRRMGDAEISPWRDSIQADQGVTARAVGWRRGDADRDDALAFWIVTGGTQHYRACAFTTRGPTDLPEAVRARYGTPASAYASDGLSTESWRSGPSEVTLTRVSSSVQVETVTDD